MIRNNANYNNILPINRPLKGWLSIAIYSRSQFLRLKGDLRGLCNSYQQQCRRTTPNQWRNYDPLAEQEEFEMRAPNQRAYCFVTHWQSVLK